MTDARQLLLQTRLQQRAFWRNPDYAFFTFALPLVLLVVLGTVNRNDRIPGTGEMASTLFVPGILAFGVIVATYANLAARIAQLRNDGVLKRIRTTPLRPAVYLGGHLISALSTTLVIALATILLGWAVFGIAPRPERAALLVLGVSLGIVCFAALALLVSAAIPSVDAASPITNATYLPLALISGVFDPTLDLPDWLRHAVTFFPIKALATTLQATYDPAAKAFPGGALVVLGAWAVGGAVLAHRWFRWQPS